MEDTIPLWVTARSPHFSMHHPCCTDEQNRLGHRVLDDTVYYQVMRCDGFDVNGPTSMLMPPMTPTLPSSALYWLGTR